MTADSLTHNQFYSMHKKFDHQTIEKKWQEKWRVSKIYEEENRDQNREKEYILAEWPYPSGNLHVGHWYAFAVPDIYVRFKRMHGIQVLYPMGFDAFGLPAENAAIKRDVNPSEWTENNIAYMQKQLESMGNAFTWNVTVSSTDPEYYKWTQWMFTKFFEKGIAYRGKGIVNWCPGCNTVLANEQVLTDDTCERCGTTVEKREMDEWKMRITSYADRLIDDLDTLAWPEHIKDAQRNWIGRSRGAQITFALNFKGIPEDNEWRDSNAERTAISVFTTRPDTLFGATYMVLAPEHPWVTLALNDTHDVFTNMEEVRAYVTEARTKSEIERTNETKEKTGVQLQGVTAVNPANKEEIPIFIADYVLAGYGTGAIMAVPAHDERDFAFAQKHNIKIVQVIAGEETLPFASHGPLINSDEFNGMHSEDVKESITRKVGGEMTNTYRLRDWSVGRQRYWGVPIPIVYDPDGGAHAIPEEHLPWHLPTDVDFKPTGEPPLAKSSELKNRTEKIFGAGWTPEVETMDTFVDSSWYFLRYIDSNNKKEFSSRTAQNTWMPVDLYFGGAEHTTMHLLYSRFWQKALYDLSLVTCSEPYVTRINRGLVLGPDGSKMSKSKGNVIDPDEHVQRLGADSVKMYLAFMGPYGEVTNYPWDMGGISGIRRFLERVNGLAEHISANEPEEITRLLHKTIMKVTEDIPLYKFNTAISSMMTFLNSAEKASISKRSYEQFLIMLAPFAPHLTEELWEQNGNMYSIHQQSFPSADPNLAADLDVTIGVQINGKMRGSITIPLDAPESVGIEKAKQNASVNRFLEGRKITKVIYVPNRILNLIVSEST